MSAIRVVSIMEASFVTGPAKNLLEFAQRCREKADGIEMSIVAYRRGGEPESAFIEAAQRADLPLDVVEEKGRFDLTVPQELRAIVDRRKADIVQTHNVKSAFFLRNSGIWKDRPWLMFHHGFTAEDVKMRLYNATTYWSWRKAAHAVTVCEPFANLLTARGIPREKITIRHNSVKPFAALDASEVARVRSSIPAPAGVPLIVAIGRLSREKGHADLLQAMELLKGSDKEAHLVLVGDGGERARLEALRESLSLNSRVTFAGLQHDVRPYFALADIIALPSHSEGSPNVLLEAMMAAKPVVATIAGGIPEIATDQETALLVPRRDPSALARALSKMLGDAALRQRLGQRAHEVAVSKFSPEAYRTAMRDLYKKLVAA